MTSTPGTIFVIGASGTVGSDLTRCLLARSDMHIRAATRDAQGKKETDRLRWVQLNLLSPASYATALRGVDRLFLLSPPGFNDPHKLLRPMVRLAKQEGVERIVSLTAARVDMNQRLPLRRLEKQIDATGIDSVHLRPNGFMQNFAKSWNRAVITQNELILPMENRKVSYIDTRDVAEIAAMALLDDELVGQTFELTGPAAISHRRIAEILSAVTGRNITWREVSDPDFITHLLQNGHSLEYAETVRQLFEHLRFSNTSAVTDDAKNLLGRPPRSFERWALDYADAWSEGTGHSESPGRPFLAGEGSSPNP